MQPKVVFSELVKSAEQNKLNLDEVFVNIELKCVNLLLIKENQD